MLGSFGGFHGMPYSYNQIIYIWSETAIADVQTTFQLMKDDFPIISLACIIDMHGEIIVEFNSM